MVFSGQIRESAAATKTFASLRVDRRVLSTPTRTIAISNISTVSVGTHVTPRPTAFFWLLAALFFLMTLGSMRPDFSWGPLTPTGATVVLGFIALAFAGLAVRPEDKTHYLLISSNDGILSRFSAPDRSILEEVRSILTEKINRNDEAMTFSVDFERGQIENLAPAHSGGHAPSQQQHVTTGGRPAHPGNSGAPPDRNSQPAAQRPRPGPGSGPAQGPAEISGPAPRPQQQPQPQRGQPALSSTLNGAAAPSQSADAFIDYTGVLPAIVEMHRFYARQAGTQHLEQRLSELELLMRAGTPTSAQKSRLRELSGEMSQILGAYPQAVELFDHIDSLV
ncbi:hypothetical protein SAMN04488557_1064 [Hyphomicrobium facile]|uniref:Uncharacterized protein n=2 Tax=Hyphomicrobium facile TaxID=51670 RepID=A0A1I7N1X0_9HYPH|nr:hypothetical protein SAMN04488557_1064 [Hyphomicrobium facile]